MLRYILFIVAIAFASVAHAQRVDMTMMLEGELRSFIVVVPLGLAPAGGFPVVFVLHGTSGDGEKFYAISGWKELVDREKLVAVFPSSLEWCVKDDIGPGTHRTTKWVNGDLLEIACAGQVFKDDVLFFRKMVDTIKTFALINTRRVFATGFSNGGLHTSKLSVAAADLFAAVAASAGPLSPTDSLIPEKSIPLWFTVGSKDDRFTTVMGVTEIPFNDTCLAYFNGIINRYTGAYQLTKDYTRVETALTLTYTFATPLPGAPPGRFMFTLVKGLFHQYPNGDNFPISAAEVFWEFFKTVAGPTSVDNSDNVASQLTVYPNPASDVVRIERSTDGAPFEVQVVNALGMMMHSAHMGARTLDLDVSALPQGMYLLRIGSTTKPLHVVRGN